MSVDVRFFGAPPAGGPAVPCCDIAQTLTGLPAAGAPATWRNVIRTPAFPNTVELLQVAGVLKAVSPGAAVADRINGWIRQDAIVSHNFDMFATFGASATSAGKTCPGIFLSVMTNQVNPSDPNPLDADIISTTDYKVKCTPFWDGVAFAVKYAVTLFHGNTGLFTSIENTMQNRTYGIRVTCNTGGTLLNPSSRFMAVQMLIGGVTKFTSNPGPGIFPDGRAMVASFDAPTLATPPYVDNYSSISALTIRTLT